MAPKLTEVRSRPPGRLQMSIFGEKSSLGVLLRLTRQAHALGDEVAHLPFFKWAFPMTILPMGIFSSLILSLAPLAQSVCSSGRVLLPPACRSSLVPALP